MIPRQSYSHTPVIRVLFSSSLAWISCRAMSVSASSSSALPRIAVAQLRSMGNKYQNLMDIATCAGQARQQNASMLFLPENCGFMGTNSSKTLENAEPPIQMNTNDIENNVNALSTEEEVSAYQALMERVQAVADGKTLEQDDADISNNNISILDGLKNIARASNLWISAGGIHERGAPPAATPASSNDGNDAPLRPRSYNTHVILDNQGEIRAVYRKIHLFDVVIPGQVNLQESASTAPGDKIITCDSPVGCLGLSTCYDLRFPEQYIELVKRGAQILLVPSAFTIPTGKAHWHILLRARAIESQCYVVAAAQSGKHNEKRESYGHALVVDPWGVVVADAGGVDSDETKVVPGISSPIGIVVCDIDLEHLKSIRQRMPVHQHRASANFH